MALEGCTPVNNAGVLPLLHICSSMSNTCVIDLSQFDRFRWNLKGGLIGFSLIAEDFEHFLRFELLFEIHILRILCYMRIPHF